ncbi:MAG: zinc ribbon domain-containing protein [Planctomycetota bacterium]
MSATASALREIHRIHRQIGDLRGRLKRGPRQLKATEANLRELEEKCAAAKESLQRTQMSTDSKQLQLQQREDRIKDLKGKLNTCNTNREYQTLKEQIAADEQANNVLSDEILEGLERIDQQQTLLAQEDKQRQEVAAELEQLRRKIETQHGELKAELDRVTHELKRAEQALPAEIKDNYQRLARSRGEEALAAVDREVCLGCYHRVSPQTLNVLMKGDACFCSTCGALLYLPEDTSPTNGT